MIAVKQAIFLAVMLFTLNVPVGRAESPRRIEVVAKRFTYEPDVLTLKKGEPVVLVFHSIDVTHGEVPPFAIPALNVSPRLIFGFSGDEARSRGGV